MKVKDKWIWVMLLAILILCSFIIFSSPGVEIRGSQFPERHKLIFSIGMSIAQEVRFILKWIANPVFILSTIMFVPIADKLANKNYLLKNHLFIHLATSIALLLALVFLGFFPPYWATGLLGQQRTVNTAYFFFLIGWYLNAAIWVGYYKEKRVEVDLALPTYFYLMSLPLIAVILLSTNNGKSALNDLITGRAYRYHQAARKRQEHFEQCARSGLIECESETIIELPETTAKPYFETNFKCDKKFWKQKVSLAGTN